MSSLCTYVADGRNANVIEWVYLFSIFHSLGTQSLEVDQSLVTLCIVLISQIVSCWPGATTEMRGHIWEVLLLTALKCFKIFKSAIRNSKGLASLHEAFLIIIINYNHIFLCISLALTYKLFKFTN